MTVTFKTATPADIPEIIALANEIWWATYPGIISDAQITYMLAEIYNDDSLRGKIDSPGRYFYLAKIGGETAGFISFSLPAEEAGAVKIHMLYVHPRHHRKGIGEALLKEASKAARKHACRYLSLNVNRANPAKDFYLRQGFAVERSVDLPFGPFTMNDYVMRRGLYA